LIKKRGENKIFKYINQYTIFHQTNSDESRSKNKDDNYLKCRYNGEVFRYSDSVIAVFLPSGSSSVNSLLPKFEAENIKVWEQVGGNVSEEAVICFNEEDIHKVHKILKFMIMGKNNQTINKSGYVVNKK